MMEDNPLSWESHLADAARQMTDLGRLSPTDHERGAIMSILSLVGGAFARQVVEKGFSDYGEMVHKLESSSDLGPHFRKHQDYVDGIKIGLWLAETILDRSISETPHES